MRPLHVLLVACLVVHLVAGAHLLVDNGEFISTHIGSPGQDVVLRIRWDLDYIGLFTSIDLPDNSATYAKSDSSDVFCIAAPCVRLQFSYISSDPPPAQSFGSVSLERTGFHGVFGLLPGSPVRREFPWLRYNTYELELLRQPPALPPGAIVPFATGCMAARANGVPSWMTLNLAVDQTFVSDRIKPTAGSQWVLEVLTLRSANSTDATFKRAAKYKLNAQLETIRITGGFAVPSIIGAPAPALPQFSSASWNASATVVVGKGLASELFDAAFGPSGELVWVNPVAMTYPPISALDYMPFVPALLVLLVLWSLGVQGDVHLAEQISLVDTLPPPRGNVATLVVGNRQVEVETDSLRQPPLPVPLESAATGASGVVTFRHAGLTRALFVFTVITAVCVVMVVFVGFGVDHAFHRPELRLDGQVAVYSSGVAALLMTALSGLVLTHHCTALVHGAGAAWALLWLLVMIEPAGPIKMVALLLTSGVLSWMLVYTWMHAVLGTLWPGVAYGNSSVARQPASSPLPHYPQPNLLLYAVWVALSTVFAGWSTWLFAFYTVPFIMRAWRPAHPTPYGVGAFALMVELTLVAFVYFSRRFVMAKLGAIGVERTRHYALDAYNQVLTIENARSASRTGASSIQTRSRTAAAKSKQQ